MDNRENASSAVVADEGKVFLYIPTDAELAEVDAQFTYQKPRENQIPRYQDVRELGRAFALSVLRNCPPSADRSAALRKIREAVATANSAIALEDHVKSGRPLVAMTAEAAAKATSADKSRA